MDTDLLKTFLEVQRTRHFGKAAENLYLTQSAVSFRIRQLEQQLGVNLFVRHRNNIQLTEAGDRLLPHAQAMLMALQRAKQEVALCNHQARQLTLGATANIWDCGLLNAFIAVQPQMPSLNWRAETLSREHLTRQLLEHQLDLALAFDPPKVDEILVSKVTDIRLLAISSQPDCRLGADTTDYVYVEWGTAFDIQHAKAFAELAPPLVRTSSARIALEQLLHNGGSAYLPEQMVQPLVAQQRLFVVPEAPKMERTLYFACRTTDNSGDLQQLFHLLRRHLTRGC
ncbi:HTH-type transcriptional regulator HdfR [Arsukibacterium sp.]|uniref:HTH-type transcriptional regulator HdfR n=1 Tax=Arsukibacterium sp. TaxID=1977258 RepID=UPI002FDADBAA